MSRIDDAITAAIITGYLAGISLYIIEKLMPEPSILRLALIGLITFLIVYIGNDIIRAQTRR